MAEDVSRSLLVVGPGPTHTEPLLRHLLAEGFTVAVAHSLPLCLRTLEEGSVALVMLDATRAGPLLEPWDLFQRTKDVADIPWVLVVRDRLEAQRALAMGAADALVLPLHLGEVAARVRAILRRRAGRSTPQRNAVLYVDRDLLIDLESEEVWVRGEKVQFTPRERALLLALARHAGQVLSPERLAWLAWHEPAAEDLRPLLKQYIWRLRQKVEQDPSEPAIIVTHRGEGYELRRMWSGQGER
ncbi:MAG: response regulator transcription factor [Anaerolineae bacterium]|nr:response regulator transcription factor [Anaerolineae bacterium]